MQITTIRAARLIAGKKQSEAAAKLGVSTQTYRKWENNPELMTIKKATILAEFLGQPLNLLLFCAKS